MIARLRGTLADKTTDSVIIDVGGVGYRLTVSQTTLATLPPEGAEASLRVHTHVREDILALYGFASSGEEELFHHLTAVSGVGPRLAVSILSGLPPAELAHAIAHNELPRLTRISGVGKKTAERLVVELADKLRTSGLLAGSGATGAPSSGASGTGAADELASALINLGYRAAEAEKAARSTRDRLPGAPLEQLVPAALQALLTRSP